MGEVQWNRPIGKGPAPRSGSSAAPRALERSAPVHELRSTLSPALDAGPNGGAFLVGPLQFDTTRPDTTRRHRLTSRKPVRWRAVNRFGRVSPLARTLGYAIGAVLAGGPPRTLSSRPARAPLICLASAAPDAEARNPGDRANLRAFGKHPLLFPVGDAPPFHGD